MIVPPTDNLRDRKVRELRRLLADLHRRGDFEEAAKVRAAIGRVERGS